MISLRTISLALAGTLGALAAPQLAHAQALPSPFDVAASLDLECYKTPGPALNINLMLTHLNPVLVAIGLPQHQVVVRELAQTCVPVRKNNAMPAPSAAPFVAGLDLACYRLDAAPLPNPVPINLTHINPVLANLPQHNVALIKPAQLCVPVAKNGVIPPPAVLQFAQYFDVECWQVDPDPHPQFALGLTQLNPVLVNQIPPHAMQLVAEPRQLCVPVRKNAQQIPLGVLSRIRWMDLEKFAANPSVFIAPVNLVLSHLNPLLANLPQIPVVLQEANSLMVPVAKNNAIPPKD
jgi:hypothetical protein